MRPKSNQIVDYDFTNGNVTNVLTSTYFRNKSPNLYPLSYVTLYEQGCKTPILAAANKLVWMDGLNTIYMKNNYEDGYKLKVCIKMEFTNSPASAFKGVSANSSSADGFSTTDAVTEQFGKVVYSLS